MSFVREIFFGAPYHRSGEVRAAAADLKIKLERERRTRSNQSQPIVLTSCPLNTYGNGCAQMSQIKPAMSGKRI